MSENAKEPKMKEKDAVDPVVDASAKAQKDFARLSDSEKLNKVFSMLYELNHEQEQQRSPVKQALNFALSAGKEFAKVASVAAVLFYLLSFQAVQDTASRSIAALGAGGPTRSGIALSLLDTLDNRVQYDLAGEYVKANIKAQWQEYFDTPRVSVLSLHTYKALSSMGRYSYKKNGIDLGLYAKQEGDKLFQSQLLDFRRLYLFEQEKKLILGSNEPMGQLKKAMDEEQYEKALNLAVKIPDPEKYKSLPYAMRSAAYALSINSPNKLRDLIKGEI